MSLTFTRAKPEDIPAVRGLQAEAVAWLAETGTRQWQPTSVVTPRGRTSDRSLEAIVDRGEVFLVLDEDELVGTLVLDEYADPEFWTDRDDPGSALYVHRMIVTRGAKGQGIGAAMLDWASEQAASRGRPWLRLDAWRTNERLHEFYREQDFSLVRVADLPHRGSGALFQRASTVPSLPARDDARRFVAEGRETRGASEGTRQPG